MKIRVLRGSKNPPKTKATYIIRNLGNPRNLPKKSEKTRQKSENNVQKHEKIVLKIEKIVQKNEKIRQKYSEN